MDTRAKKVKKVKVPLSLTKEAQANIFDHDYASARTQGDFISQLIVDYHAQAAQRAELAALAGELHRLADRLAEHYAAEQS